MACREVGVGRVIGIDAWDASACIKDEVQENVQWWSKCDLDKIRTDFMWKLDSLGLAQTCEIIKAKSDDVEVPKEIGLLHIDGSHTDQAIRDVQRFATNVVKGGIVVCDDVNWTQGSVLRAIDVLTEMGFKELYRVLIEPTDDYAVFQKL
jgi:hypothetical protein